MVTDILIGHNQNFRPWNRTHFVMGEKPKFQENVHTVCKILILIGKRKLCEDVVHRKVLLVCQIIEVFWVIEVSD